MHSFRIHLICLWALLFLPLGNAHALTISAAKPAMPAIEAAFPDASRISDKAPAGGDDGPLIRTIYQADTVLGYAFETRDILDIPAYSGQPINILVAMDTQGNFIDIQLL
jgi:NosR/NirI family nitrous oxide reductase transcriptional regulator